MIQHNICPICGNENPEGAEFCQVCKANLRALPDDILSETVSTGLQQTSEPDTTKPEDTTIDSSSPVPAWLQKRFQQKDKRETFDIDSYTNALFGAANKRDPIPPARKTKPAKVTKPETVYQPFFENLIEPPLIEPDENSAKTITENIPGIADFLIRRPARKWDDRLPSADRFSHKGNSVDLLHDFSAERPSRKWDDQETSAVLMEEANENNALQPLLWWSQDAPLVEPDEWDSEEKTSADGPELDNSVSPTKLADADKLIGSTEENTLPRQQQGFPPVHDDTYEPENGSLLSDLMNEMNSSSGSLTPAEQQEKENGTVFFSGNHPAEDDIPLPDQEPELIEINTSEEANGGNAAMLDQILRGFGYQVEGEAQPLPQTKENDKADPVSTGEQSRKKHDPDPSEVTREEPQKLKVNEVFIPQVIENPLIPDDDEDLDEKEIDSYELYGDEKIPSKVDDTEELDIPWDLFGAADMALPQSPEDPEYRAFSRSGLPDEADATAYQQRMISSILGKIIHAENFVEPEQEKNDRYISPAGRLFWTLLAVCGIIMILITGFVDHLMPETVRTDPLSTAFYEAAADAGENALVVIDYTPAYSSLMDSAAQKLLSSLEEHTNKLYLAALNPAAMPFTQQILKQHAEKLEFDGWWPAGLISIRTRIAFGNLPEQIWLLTSESSSVQNWAEQLAVSNGTYKLHVMAPGQLAPLLKPYLSSQLVTSALCNDMDLMNYGEETHNANRAMMAVWYLSALIPLAWLFGGLTKFFRTKPNYERNSFVNSEDSPQDLEKETENG